MKYLILMTTVFICFGNVRAQDIPASSVPTAVKNALLSTHSNPRDVEWEKKGANYKVEYDIGRNDHELWITPSGEVIKHKEGVSSSNLPMAVKNLIKTDYKAYKIDDTDKLTVGSNVLYKVELEKGWGNSKEEIDLILDESAKVYEITDWYQLIE